MRRVVPAWFGFGGGGGWAWGLGFGVWGVGFRVCVVGGRVLRFRSGLVLKAHRLCVSHNSMRASGKKEKKESCLNTRYEEAGPVYTLEISSDLLDMSLDSYLVFRQVWGVPRKRSRVE